MTKNHPQSNELIGAIFCQELNENTIGINLTLIPLIAIGHALVMDPEWVEKTADGREVVIDSELKVSKLDLLDIPEKLWNVIQAMPGWFTISKQEQLNLTEYDS